MSRGYIDEMGEYCEYYEERPHEKHVNRKAAKKASYLYWNSLTQEEREVIQWCQNWAKSHGNHAIQWVECRNHWIMKFIATLGHSETPKKQEAYKICFDNFKAFKKFINENPNI